VRALVVALVILCSVAAVRAESDDSINFHIVLVGNDPELVDALKLVMEGRNTGVIAVGDRPSPSLAELGPESRRLADAYKAVATVWLSPTAAGATLVTYQRDVDRFVAREVPYKLPLDETQAFETARMVSVMLRSLENRNDEAAVTKRVNPLPRPSDPQLAASLGVGAWFASPETTLTPMTTLVIAWRPYNLGAAISATFAPTTDLETGSFTGDVRVSRIAAEARKALRLAPRVRVTPGVGVALHAVTLGGRFGVSDMIHSRRYDPALQLSTLVGIALPHRIELGLAVSADCLLRRQRYAAGTEEILDVPRIQGMMAILFGVRL